MGILLAEEEDQDRYASGAAMGSGNESSDSDSTISQEPRDKDAQTNIVQENLSIWGPDEEEDDNLLALAVLQDEKGYQG